VWLRAFKQPMVRPSRLRGALRFRLTNSRMAALLAAGTPPAGVIRVGTPCSSRARLVWRRRGRQHLERVARRDARRRV
jgi:hypothetical protein